MSQNNWLHVEWVGHTHEKGEKDKEVDLHRSFPSNTLFIVLLNSLQLCDVTRRREINNCLSKLYFSDDAGRCWFSVYSVCWMCWSCCGATASLFWLVNIPVKPISCYPLQSRDFVYSARECFVEWESNCISNQLFRFVSCVLWGIDIFDYDSLIASHRLQDIHFLLEDWVKKTKMIFNMIQIEYRLSGGEESTHPIQSISNWLSSHSSHLQWIYNYATLAIEKPLNEWIRLLQHFVTNVIKSNF